MISTALTVCLAVASAAIVIALMMWKPRQPAKLKVNANWRSRDVTFTSLLLSFAAAMGLARAQAEQSGNTDSAYSWHGSHLDHSRHGGIDRGGFSDGGGFSGGDGGGGGI
jgi:uncharacterized membrane protein YgcG